MKSLIRSGVFETNSSSTHTLSICTKEEYDKWLKGDLLLYKYSDGKAKFRSATGEPIGSIENYVKEYYEDTYGRRAFTKKYEDLTENEKAALLTEYKNQDDPEDYISEEDWGERLETYKAEYTTAHGDEIVIFGEYGYD